ncbi:unnamed protein product [Durusdinium trenchii]|uniref:Bifunctional lysine-specific demethylase and histidyl-hydroxylase n=1 Tax=Durusdinium trenchii TaxID=1381693 RepID=A0ABP0MIY8_9DINO
MPSIDENHFLQFVPKEVQAGHGSLEDAFYLPGFLCKEQDSSLFQQLQKELSFKPAWLENGLPFSRQLCVASDLNTTPTLHAILEHLAEAVLGARETWTWYRHGGDFCNLHSDQYEDQENFSLGISFGQDRGSCSSRDQAANRFSLPSRRRTGMFMPLARPSTAVGGMVCRRSAAPAAQRSRT